MARRAPKAVKNEQQKSHNTSLARTPVSRGATTTAKRITFHERYSQRFANLLEDEKLMAYLKLEEDFRN